jgi:glutamine amidotransferase
MCELLAVASLYPTTVRLSLDELARHGGETGPHVDGWGIALTEGRDVLVHRAPEPAAQSRWLRFLGDSHPRSALTLVHIRKATVGDRRLCNTQPFVRELGGRMHVFAHNGTLTGLHVDERFMTRRFRPVGETDSEQAFCALLDRLAPLYERADSPTLDDRLACIAAFARELAGLGPANFLYGDGEMIVAHAHRRTQPDGTIRAPGLHLLCRTCTAADDGMSLAGVELDADGRQNVALVSSVPLSAEPWEALAEGEIAVLREGRVERRFLG